MIKLTRDEIIEMVKVGFLNKKSIFHYDVCKELAKGKATSKIVEERDLREPKTIRNIRDRKCPFCNVD